MALVERNQLKATKKLDSSIELPRDRYTGRCTSEEFGLSKSSGVPMVTRTWELIEPQAITIGNAEVSIVGTKLTQYLSLGSQDPAKVDSNLQRFLDENGKLGLKSDAVDTEHPIPTPAELKANPELAAESAVGKVVDMCCASEDYSPRKQPTPEQKKAGKQGDPILVNGKPITRYNPKLVEVYGISSYDTTQGGTRPF